MHNCKIKAYPKVNLTLDVLGKDASGYHKIQSVMHQIHAPFDEVHFEKSETFSLVCSDHELSSDENNTIVKAVRLFAQHFGIEVRGVFTLSKAIPLAAGLGGGSSDGAAMLKLLAHLYNVQCCGVDNAHESFVDSCHAPHCPLFELARRIGMDVPFFINGGTQLAMHFGEVLEILPSVSPFFKFEVLPGPKKISTKNAYEDLNLAQCGKCTQLTTDFIDALKVGDAQKMLAAVHNDFEENENRPSQEIRNILAGSGGSRLRISMLK